MSLRLLDLFCGAGGAARGYQTAGFEVVGVDVAPQPRFPGEFWQEDALWADLSGFDAFHASPPCQRWSVATNRPERWPDLIEPIRRRLLTTGRPFIIENVVGAPVRPDLLLCGSMFGLNVRRHRLFECERFMPLRLCCHHAISPKPITVTGTGYGNYPRHRKGENLAEALTAMGMAGLPLTRRELTESLPPAYTAYIGPWLRAAIGENG